MQLRNGKNRTLSFAGHLGEQTPVVGGSEWCQIRPHLQFQQMLTPSLRSLGILRADVRLDTQLVTDNSSRDTSGSVLVGTAKPG
ncbi:hypothetical protein METHB2_150003 [Candidatus Methylobacter favarea]|uniref:Uncharacterized protein n=1 Tax=Candidatus Methylobacter favarea TaxID=2707345 RepID=A0A8S0WHK2_9GAMM|nr:hypothetical protein [Candidatus Methylobacter favarea]CAA9889879.1 hypothetical protein METHB2_150003 [Candidatus Methylobacter favarea]